MSVKEIAPHIAVDETVRFGKPVIQGTRVAVSTILGHLAAGDAPEGIAEDYGITREDVLACIAYARRLVDEDSVRAIP